MMENLNATAYKVTLNNSVRPTLRPTVADCFCPVLTHQCPHAQSQIHDEILSRVWCVEELD